MPVVVGVSFRAAAKVYYFDPGPFELHEGTAVLAQTARGLEYGTVVSAPRDVPPGEVVSPLKQVVRVATDEDTIRAQTVREREQEALRICQQKIAEHKLPMKLIEVESTFDGSRMVFYFGAEKRVDFRNLVKDLAATFRTRIELRQVGVRDEAKLVGGIGTCGRALCCATFLSNFEPVGIKMAKEQGLSLNPLKISGVCGRLLCCLNYEYAVYREAKERFPKVNSEVGTPQGTGRVIELSVTKETVTVLFGDGAHAEFPLADIELGENAPCAAGGLCRKEGPRRPRRSSESEPTAPCGQRCPAAQAAARMAERLPSGPAAAVQAAPTPAAQPAQPAAAAQAADGGAAEPGEGGRKRRRRPRRRRHNRPQNSSGDAVAGGRQPGAADEGNG